MTMCTDNKNTDEAYDRLLKPPRLSELQEETGSSDNFWWNSRYHERDTTEDENFVVQYGELSNVEAMTCAINKCMHVVPQEYCKKAVKLGQVTRLVWLVTATMMQNGLGYTIGMGINPNIMNDNVPRAMISLHKPSEMKKYTFAHDIVVYDPYDDSFERQCRYTAFGNCKECGKLLPLGIECTDQMHQQEQNKPRSVTIYTVIRSEDISESTDYPNEFDPVNPAKLAEMMGRPGILPMFPEWYEKGDHQLYDPNYNKNKSLNIKIAIKLWLKKIKTPYEIVNPYVEHDLNHVFHLGKYQQRTPVNHYLLPHLNTRMKEFIHENRYAQDSEDIATESTASKESKGWDLAQGPLAADLWYPTKMDIKQWETNPLDFTIEFDTNTIYDTNSEEEEDDSKHDNLESGNDNEN